MKLAPRTMELHFDARSRKCGYMKRVTNRVFARRREKTRAGKPRRPSSRQGAVRYNNTCQRQYTKDDLEQTALTIWGVDNYGICIINGVVPAGHL